MKTLIISSALLFCMLQLSAQTIVTDSLTKNRAYLRYGLEPTTMLSFGFQRNIDIGIKDRFLTVYGEWSSSTTKFGNKNSEIKIGGIIPIYQYRSFKIINNLGFSAGSITTKHFESKKFAVSDEIALGIYKNKWFIATTFEYEKIYLNKIEHSEFYRRTYYEDAVDGWYKGAGGMFQFGIEGGITLKERFDLHAELKLPFTEKFNNYEGSPAHVNLGIGYRF